MQLRISPGLLDEVEDQARVMAECPEWDPARERGRALQKALNKVGYQEAVLTDAERPLARLALESALDVIGNPHGLNLSPTVKAAGRRTLERLRTAVRSQGGTTWS